MKTLAFFGFESSSCLDLHDVAQFHWKRQGICHSLSFLSRALITSVMSSSNLYCFSSQLTQTFLMWKMLISWLWLWPFFRIHLVLPSLFRDEATRTENLTYDSREHWFVQWQNSSLFFTSFLALPDTWVTFQVAARPQPNVCSGQLILITRVFRSESFWYPVKLYQGVQGYSNCFFPFWHMLPELCCTGAGDMEILQSCQYEWKLWCGMDSSARNIYLHANTEKEIPHFFHYSL